MKNILTKTYSLIPISKRKKLPKFFLYSLINTLLDLVSLAFLTPLILILLDKNKTRQLVFDFFKIGINERIITLALILLVFFYFLKNIFQSRIIKIQSKYIYAISENISKNLIKKFINNNYTKYNNTDKNIYFRDVFQIPMIFSNHILFSIYIIFSEIIILLLIVISSLIYQPKTTIYALLILSILVVLFLKYKKKNVDFFNETIINLYQENTKNIMNIFFGYTEIKSTKSEEKFEIKFNESISTYNNQLASLSSFKQSNSRHFETLFIVGLALIILFFIYNKNKEVNLILLSFFVGASVKIIPSFNKILSSYLDIKTNSNCVDILLEYNDLVVTHLKEIDFKKKIELVECGFSFQEKKILKDITLKINKGDFITIKGKSGEGKSTLLNLVAGLLVPQSGKICIDNSVMKNNNYFFNFIGYVPQQPFLFQGTLLENITMLNNDKIDYDYLNEIITALDLQDWINDLPNGMETPLLFESKKISGGQKQRIAIARALYFNPKILILDEATSQLNESLELKILDYLNKLVSQKKLTIIAVSHTEKINLFANKKYILENGEILNYD